MAIVEKLNAMNETQVREVLFTCCGSTRWVDLMLEEHPFRDDERLFKCASSVWFDLGPEDWREAFAQHPKIGDLDSLKKKFASTAAMAGSEQSGVTAASDEVLQGLAKGNQSYEERFGFIFIVCATGKSATEMLAMLRSRLDNDDETEIMVAAEEQKKITRLRLEKL